MEFTIEQDEQIKLREAGEQKERAGFSIGAPKKIKMSPEKCQKLCEKVGLKYEEGYEKRIIEHIITDETKDRYGDIIRAKGVKFDNYKKNSVIQFAHNSGNLPIGKSIKFWYDKEEKNIKSYGLYFDDRIDKSGWSDLVFKYITAGGLPACSVGFVPLKVHRPKTSEERTEMGLGEYGLEYQEIDLLEYSPCPIGANPNALTNSLTEGIRNGTFNQKDCKQLIEGKFLPEEILENFIKEVEEKFKKETAEDEIRAFCEKYDCCCVDEIELNPDIDLKEWEKSEIAELKDIVLRPFPNEHSCRFFDPKKYDKFRRGTRKSDGKTYSIIFGKKKDSNKWEEQAYRYNIDEWTKNEAKKHCTDHKGASFEAATGKEIDDNTTNTVNIMKLDSTVKNFVESVDKLANEIKNLVELLKKNPVENPANLASDKKTVDDLYNVLQVNDFSLK